MKRTVAEFHQTTNKIPPPRNHGTLNLFPVLEPEVGEQTEEQKKTSKDYVEDYYVRLLSRPNIGLNDVNEVLKSTSGTLESHAVKT